MIILLLFLLLTATASFVSQLDALKLKYEKNVNVFIEKIEKGSFDDVISATFKADLSEDEEYPDKFPWSLIDLIERRREVLSIKKISREEECALTDRYLDDLKNTISFFIETETKDLSGRSFLGKVKGLAFFLEIQSNHFNELTKKIIEPILERASCIKKELSRFKCFKEEHFKKIICFKKTIYSFLNYILIIKKIIENTNLSYFDFSSKRLKSIYELARRKS